MQARLHSTLVRVNSTSRSLIASRASTKELIIAVEACATVQARLRKAFVCRAALSRANSRDSTLTARHARCRRVRVMVLPVGLAHGTGRRPRGRVVASARASITCSGRIGVQVSQTSRTRSARRSTGSSDASSNAHVARSRWVTVFIRLTSSTYGAFSRANRAERADITAHTWRRCVRVSIVRAVLTAVAGHCSRDCVRSSITCRTWSRCITIQVSCATRAWVAARATHTSVVSCSARRVVPITRSGWIQIVVVEASRARKAFCATFRGECADATRDTVGRSILIVVVSAKGARNAVNRRTVAASSASCTRSARVAVQVSCARRTCCARCRSRFGVLAFAAGDARSTWVEVMIDLASRACDTSVQADRAVRSDAACTAGDSAFSRERAGRTRDTRSGRVEVRIRETESTRAAVVHTVRAVCTSLASNALSGTRIRAFASTAWRAWSGRVVVCISRSCLTRRAVVHTVRAVCTSLASNALSGTRIRAFASTAWRAWSG